MGSELEEKLEVNTLSFKFTMGISVLSEVSFEILELGKLFSTVLLKLGVLIHAVK